MMELTVDAVLDNLGVVTDFVNEKLDSFGCAFDVEIQLDIAIDELFSNIANYAYGEGTGTATIRVELSESPRSVSLTFLDHGTPYNPLLKPDPDITLSAEEREIGGLGIFMVKKSMDHMSYAYKDGQNILTIRKNLD